MMVGDFVEVRKEDLDKYQGKLQGAHCMLYARLPDSTFEKCPHRAAVLMQMRFDGHVGFPGGLIEPGEDVVSGLMRELEEEMNFDSQNQITELNHVVTHWNPSGQILLHFYRLEISPEQLRNAECRAINSDDYGKEVLGFFRVPLYTMSDGHCGFPTFLANSFVGNSYQQLKLGLLGAAIMTSEEYMAAEEICKTSYHVRA